MSTEQTNDRIRSEYLTEQLTNKTISKVTLVDTGDSTCYGRITFEFTDGTYFTIDEARQDGEMRYEVLPTAEVFFAAVEAEQQEAAMNAVIDHVINETLAAANLSIMNDEDVVAYLNKKYSSFKGVEMKQFVETHRAEFLADSIKYTNAVINQRRANK
jgi:hypothetical protein